MAVPGSVGINRGKLLFPDVLGLAAETHVKTVIIIHYDTSNNQNLRNLLEAQWKLEEFVNWKKYIYIKTCVIR